MEDVPHIVEFRRVTERMELRDGMRILIRRLGLTVQKLHAMVRDRYPSADTKKENGHLGKFRIKCFLRSDITFSDVLHVGYDELALLGVGRRYLVNRILRTILSGMCDSLDTSGRAGDFPPRSWLTPDHAEFVRGVQEECIHAMKIENAGKLESLKARLRLMSTPLLISLSESCQVIRSEVRKASVRGLDKGIEKFSDMLKKFKKLFFYGTRKDDVKNRIRAVRREGRGLLKYRPLAYYGKHRKLSNSVRRQRAHKAESTLRMSLTDLRKSLDPRIMNWYRRPSDPDWYEGMRSDRRKPVLFNRKLVFRRHGLCEIPGITGDVTAEEWWSLRTDWKIAEVRRRFSEEHALQGDAT